MIAPRMLRQLAPCCVRVCLIGCALISIGAGNADSAESTPRLSYNRDVRPILSEYCWHCHGPDKNQRQGELRLDDRADSVRNRDGHAAIVPGKPEQSSILARLTTADRDERMPPVETQRTLTAAQVETIRRWIAEGAEFEPHWSFLPPQRSTLPTVSNSSWPQQPIDHFILARLDRESIKPSREADRATLLRRVTLDLTGLPPTPAEVDAFLNDLSPDAYERVVDRLLASHRYGERMALPWLEAARYADTNGYQTDGPRFMWRWRDWVIEAFNRNQPFDQFTIEQLAGDQLPKATLDQLIATGFNRNHRGNAEGGIIPEEFRIEYVVDRVETTATVWLGLTLGCARCHDHKYDPASQKEFYQLFAFFNQVNELGKVVRDDNSPPMVKAPTDEMQAKLADFDRRIANLDQAIVDKTASLAAAQASWEQAIAGRASHERETSDKELIPGLAVAVALDGDFDRDVRHPQPAVAGVSSTSKAAAAIEINKPKAVDPPTNVASPRVVDGDETFASGKIGKAIQLDGKSFVDLGPLANFGDIHRFSFGAWIQLADARGGTIVAKMEEDFNHKGYGLHVDDGHVQVSLSNRALDDAVHVESTAKLEPGRWYHVFATYDGGKFASGIRLYVDGQLQPVKVLLDTLSNPIANDEPLRIGSRGAQERFAGLVDDVRLFAQELTADQVAIVATPEILPKLVAIAPENRTVGQRDKLREYFMRSEAAEPYRRLLAARDELLVERRRFEEEIPTVMVMRDGPKIRETFMLVRGEYDKPGEQVAASVPAWLPSLPKSASADRMALARWLVDGKHPLTARVTVNRYWQMLFGLGLVKTTEDFGAQGEAPSHPELLDWLAVEFVESGWDIKHLLKLMVTSATYRQSSRVSKSLIARDPENRLLARGPRFRLSAEMVRDQALFASGLLNERVGGPSVKPYQPAGLWEELAAAIVPYVQDHGPDLYRRSLYTYWKRTVAPPSMMTFDAAGREACVVRTSRTNTPLQALNLLNDVTYVEAARYLAEQVMREKASTDDRLSLLYRRVLSRPPTDDERRMLRESVERYTRHFREHTAAADELLSFGESPRDEQLPTAELAAYATIASTIFNLDETITRE